MKDCKSTWSTQEYKEYKDKGIIPIQNSKVIPKYQKEKITQNSKTKPLIKSNKQLYLLLRLKEDNNEVIFIPGNICSSKNSKQILQIYKKNNQGKRPIIADSKLVKKYKEEHKDIYTEKAKNYHNIISKRKLTLPLFVGLYFIRKTTHRFDGNNASQIITDLMTKYKWHNDDDMNNMTILPLGYHKDKDNAGVYIFLLDNKIKTEILNYI